MDEMTKTNTVLKALDSFFRHVVKNFKLTLYILSFLNLFVLENVVWRE